MCTYAVPLTSGSIVSKLPQQGSSLPLRCKVPRAASTMPWYLEKRSQCCWRRLADTELDNEQSTQCTTGKSIG